MIKNLFAYTQAWSEMKNPGSGYPGYISVNKKDDDERVWILVRSDSSPDPSEIYLTREQCIQLAKALL